MKCTKWCVGIGDQIRFWDDEWVGNFSLKDKYPRIFAVTQNKNMFVNEANKGVGKDRVWNVQVIRNLNDQETTTNANGGSNKFGKLARP